MLANVFSYSLVKAGPQGLPESLYDRGAECFLIGCEFTGHPQAPTSLGVHGCPCA
jgi:hypothetical protein